MFNNMKTFTDKLTVSFDKVNVEEIKSQLSFKEGIYFWFADLQTLALLNFLTDDIEKLFPMPEHDGYHLVYIGIGPSSINTKKQFLSNRIIDCHLGKYLTNSTLRQSLASLLKFNGYSKKSGKKNKFFITPDLESEITDIITKHFRLGVIQNSKPWEVEKLYILRYEPPFNLTHNTKGWFYKKMKNCRDAFNETCKSNFHSEVKSGVKTPTKLQNKSDMNKTRLYHHKACSDLKESTNSEIRAGEYFVRTTHKVMVLSVEICEPIENIVYCLKRKNRYYYTPAMLLTEEQINAAK